MAKEVKVPKISEGVESAEVTEVLVSEGDTIKEEQSIIAVETDKASVEVPSSDSGKVKEIKVKEGDEVKVGDVILILEEDGEGEEKEEKEEKEKEEPKAEKEEEEGKKEEKKEGEEEKEEAKAEKKEGEEKKEEEEDKEEEKAKKEEEEKEEKEEAEEVPASPSVRRLARELGVEIRAVEGSGPGGRITEEDVKSQTKEKAGKAREGGPAQPALPDFSKWGKVERESLSNIRKATAKNTATSWQTIPHVTQFDEADITNIEEYRKQNSEKVEKAGGKLTVTAILLKIVANALQQFPKFNASLDMENEEVILKRYLNIGIAVDTEKGLLVPVIRDVGRKSITELSVEITELAEKARNQQLSLEDMKGGNFNISNLGGIGGTNFTPIVYHPQVAVLGVARAKTQPVFIEGKFEPRQVLPLSLSYDHRLIDGAEGAEFLHWICQALEDPYTALLGT